MVGDEIAMGPGKADLLDNIAKTGSIAAAGRAMGMSYKRAWDLVEQMNRSFTEKLVETSKGGAGRGGAVVTAFGEEVVRQYRSAVLTATRAADEEAQKLLALTKSD
ncbi:winged helix-turn-helix domain-containing protein [Kordiimonas sp.]|uniref:winged helix-turn-helix domain-containing protein n=1 Tax=Kordiimonas sp. TaxID=1970157 RepID=UPI003A9072B9